MSFAWLKNVLMVIVMDCIMTFFGSTANDAAYNAWLTDRGDETNRGRIEGVNSMMPLVSILIVFGSFLSFDLERMASWRTIYYIIGAATVLIGVLGFFLIEEAPGLQPDRAPLAKTLVYSFRRCSCFLCSRVSGPGCRLLRCFRRSVCLPRSHRS